MSRYMDSETKLYLAIIAGILLLFCMRPVYVYSTEDTVTFTVNKMENVVGRERSKYLIFTDGEVFQNDDSWLYLKFNSSDMYNEMRVGSSYKAKVYGWRVPFLSWYRNVVSIERI